jgi:hypothetical protein
MTTTVKTTGILFPDDTLQTTAATPSSSLNYSIYTSSGSTTWTCPAGITKVLAIVAGGGGASTGDENSTGGTGGMGIGVVTVTPGTSYNVTVGAGAAVSGSGGTSSFAGTISATGGSTGSHGAGSGGNISNGISARTAFFCNQRSTLDDTYTAVAYSSSGSYLPGAPGFSGPAAQSSAGVGGAVLLMYL